MPAAKILILMIRHETIHLFYDILYRNLHRIATWKFPKNFTFPIVKVLHSCYNYFNYVENGGSIPLCTAICLHSDTHYFGRNLDLEYGYNETVTITPRNYPFDFKHTESAASHYAMIGMATVIDGYPLYYEATNEHGLSIAGLNFPKLAHYNKPTPGKLNVAVFEFVPWLLSQCKNMDDVNVLIPKLNLVDTPFSADFPPTPLHWIIADKDQCLVLESTAEGLKSYDNPIGVLTNAPEFPYHMTHLKDYQNISPLPPENRFSASADMTPYSGAMGAVGLPGDWSSASRFVRAAFVRCNTPTLPTPVENINHFFRILQSVAMPMGSIQLKPGLHDLTRYSSCCDTNAGKYYYTTYANSRITCVDMHAEDLDSEDVIRYSLNNIPDILIQTQR